MGPKQEEIQILLPQKDSQTVLEELKAKKENLQANLNFYGQAEDTHGMDEEFYSYFDESMREIGKWSFGRRLVQIGLLLATFVGMLSAALAIAIRHMSLAIQIIPITASFAVLNSFIELASDMYNYFRTPKEQRTALHQYKLATAPVSTLLIGGTLAASIMIGLAIPGGFIALALAFSAYLIFKLCQGCIGKSLREQGRQDAEMELIHVNKEITKLEKHEENSKAISLMPISSPTSSYSYKTAKSEDSTPHGCNEGTALILSPSANSAYESAKSEDSTPHSRNSFFQHDDCFAAQKITQSQSSPIYESDANNI